MSCAATGSRSRATSSPACATATATTAPAPPAARQWLAAQADPVTTEEEWSAKPLLARNVALSYAGLEALRLPGWLLESLPRDFRDGMAARADCTGDAGDGAPERWDAGLRAGEIHVLVSIAGRGDAAVREEAGRVAGEMAAHGL